MPGRHAQLLVRNLKTGGDTSDIDFEEACCYAIVGIDRRFGGVADHDVPGQTVHPGELPKHAHQ
jgi:hypothetical protein